MCTVNFLDSWYKHQLISNYKMGWDIIGVGYRWLSVLLYAYPKSQTQGDYFLFKKTNPGFPSLTNLSHTKLELQK